MIYCADLYSECQTKVEALPEHPDDWRIKQEDTFSILQYNTANLYANVMATTLREPIIKHIKIICIQEP